jgi:hypothetical protein
VLQRFQAIDHVHLFSARGSKLFSRSQEITGAIQRMPLSAVQFTFVIWLATTSASKRQRPIRAAAPSFTMT